MPIRLRFERGWSLRRVLATVGLAVALGTVVLAVDVLVRYLPAFQALQQGRDAATSAEVSIRAALAHGDATDFAAANAALVRARDDFSVHSTVLDDGWVANIATHLPWVGDQVRAAQQMRHAGAYGSQLGIDLLPVVQQVVPSPRSHATGTLARLFAAATAQASSLDTAQGDLNAFDTAVAQIPTGSLVGPLDHLRTSLDTRAASLSATAHLALNFLTTAPSALGSTERRYLVMVNNPGEERPGGGFIGAIGEIDVKNGQILSEVFQDSAFANGHIRPEPAPRPLDAYLFHGVPWELSDANWSADFPTSAAAVSRLYTEATGHTMDGVISVDPVALSYVLKVVGAVHVSPYPQTISASNTLLDLNYIINKARPGDPGKAFLPPLAKLLFDRLLTPSSGQLSPLVAALGRGVQEKHVVLYFTDPALETLVTGVHADGALRDPPTDGLQVTDANLSAGKDDLFVQRHFALTATVAANGSVQHKLVLTYQFPVQTNPANLNLIQNLGGDYADYVQVTVPTTANLDNIALTAAGATTAVSAESITNAGAHTTFAYFLTVPQGQTVSLEFDYSGAFAVPGAGYQVVWEKQLNALTWPITVDVNLPGRPARHWASDLGIDRQFTVP